MSAILALAVLVYAGHGADAGTAANARASLIAALPVQTKVVEHAIDESIAARRAGWRSVSELGFLGRARDALIAGRRARERVELDEAAQQLGIAEAAYAEGIFYPGVASLAAEAALEHGVTLGELGRMDDARVAFRRALARSPGIVLTERTARPDVVRVFREVAKSKPAPLAATDAPPDTIIDGLLALREAPASFGSLVDALGLDAAIVGVVSTDGTKLLVARATEGCVTDSVLIKPSDSAATARALSRLLEAACAANPVALSVDDPRLAPAPAVAVAFVAHAKPASRKPRVWPFVLAGAVGLSAAIIGVTIAFVSSDARYAVKVDASTFGR